MYVHKDQINQTIQSSTFIFSSKDETVWTVPTSLRTPHLHLEILSTVLPFLPCQRYSCQTYPLPHLQGDKCLWRKWFIIWSFVFRKSSNDSCLPHNSRHRSYSSNSASPGLGLCWRCLYSYNNKVLQILSYVNILYHVMPYLVSTWHKVCIMIKAACSL